MANDIQSSTRYPECGCCSLPQQSIFADHRHACQPIGAHHQPQPHPHPRTVACSQDFKRNVLLFSATAMGRKQRDEPWIPQPVWERLAIVCCNDPRLHASHSKSQVTIGRLVFWMHSSIPLEELCRSDAPREGFCGTDTGS
jgi:hypothetical protein